MPSQGEVNQRFYAWYQAMELSHAMLMAGLRHKVGPSGDVQQAYRDWYQAHRARKWSEIEAVQQARAAIREEFSKEIDIETGTESRRPWNAT